MDQEASQENLENFRQRFPKQEIIPVSALSGEGIAALKARLNELIGYHYAR